VEKQNKRVKLSPEFSSTWEPLDDEERELEEMFENGTIAKALEKRSLKNAKTRQQKTTAQPNKVPVTIRLDKLTLLVLKDRAQTEGLRYQSLINAVLHRFITGQLVERKK
jgi:predicted DNA binding CopG/RHH family protein